MSFNFFLFRGIRLLLFPVSLVVGLYITIRNGLYDIKWLKSTSFNLPLICVGNLSMGGTGKSPMTEYLLRLLTQRYAVGVLSRGYKRKTTGYILAGEQTNALEIGDEPMQFHKKFPQASIAVGEERVEAIPQLLHDRPDTRVVVLDDAFQHRAISAGLNILLTDFSNPYWFDTFLPTGELRDNKDSARRADIIIVTKCPGNLDEEKKIGFLGHINPRNGQKVFFTTIDYGTPYHIYSGSAYELNRELEVLLVCGIANPTPLKVHLENHVEVYFEKNFDDHHIFSIDDWLEIVEKFEKIEATQKIILTTEKDAVRLEKFGELLEHKPVFVIPIRHRFLFNEGSQFDNMIIQFIETFPITSAIE